MTEREICEHLTLKLEEFLQKIEDLELRCSLKEKIYFAGGCIYCLRNDRTVKDYDLFLKDYDLIEELAKLDFWSYISDYALTYGKFQIVTKYFGEPESCVSQFDFKHNMHYYIAGESKIQCAYKDEILDEVPDFDHFKYLETNELHFNENRARDIEGVYLRIEKFINRGMTVSKETIKKIKKRTTKKQIKDYKRSRIGNGRSYY